MAWTFILRRVTLLAEEKDQKRVAAAMPTVQRFGYAIGAAYIGIIANAVGLESMHEQDVAVIAKMIFLACLPFALIGIIATLKFISTAGND